MRTSGLSGLKPVHVEKALSEARADMGSFKAQTLEWLSLNAGLYAIALRAYYEKALPSVGIAKADAGFQGYLLAARTAKNTIEDGAVALEVVRARVISKLAGKQFRPGVEPLVTRSIEDVVGSENLSPFLEIKSIDARSTCVAGLCFLLPELEQVA